MITKYRYISGSQTIETLDVNTIPQGVSYETIDFEIETEVVEQPKEVSLNERIAQLESELAEIKASL